MELSELKTSDFVLKEFNHYMSYDCDYFPFDAWGDKWEIGISINHKKDSDIIKDKIPAYLESCKKHIEWIRDNKDKFIKAMLDDGMVELANDWASSEETERDGKIYYTLVDDIEIEAPITKEKFISYIVGGGMNLYINVEEDSFSYDIFLSTEPDLFAYHSIEVFLDVDKDFNYNITVNGLAG